MTMPPDSPTAKQMNNVKIIYGLYALGYFVAITTLVGAVLAYMWRGNDRMADSHFTFQIRTFWISLLIGLLALITMVIGVGFLIWIFLTVWGLLRVISGFLLANDGKPVSNTKYLGMMAE
ncbi:DUF4870 family protein [Paracoccus fistulariae]|uniref:DUF4870 domain-containing protein n=1 Tax=Paracoccus fistulariae TaxID=658446 RepID=A0ABY7SNV3_9RHOB|nr:hypothetical protein [Paracoccus fistulariae]MDB6182503.1 hypothetical protein [Paracoccus fistulariae]WCR07717.1 hypothetical protein JHX87_02450 [Paracoccus fistulariae]